MKRPGLLVLPLAIALTAACCPVPTGAVADAREARLSLHTDAGAAAVDGSRTARTRDGAAVRLTPAPGRDDIPAGASLYVVGTWEADGHVSVHRAVPLANDEARAGAP